MGGIGTTHQIRCVSFRCNCCGEDKSIYIDKKCPKFSHLLKEGENKICWDCAEKRGGHLGG